MMQAQRMDTKDNEILDILQKNARATYSEIGEKVHLSRVSVKNRIEAMEKQGIIRGYETRIGRSATVGGRRFFMEIVIEPESYDTVVSYFRAQTCTHRLYAVSGNCQVMLEGFAPDVQSYEDYMRSVRRHLQGIKSIAVWDVQYTIKDADGGICYEEREE